MTFMTLKGKMAKITRRRLKKCRASCNTSSVRNKSCWLSELRKWLSDDTAKQVLKIFVKLLAFALSLLIPVIMAFLIRSICGDVPQILLSMADSQTIRYLYALSCR